MPLRQLLEGLNELERELNLVEEIVSEPLLISWLDDFSTKYRPKNTGWKVVLLATEAGYEFPKTLLISY